MRFNNPWGLQYLRPSSSVDQGGAEGGEGWTASQVGVSLLPVEVVDYHPEHGEEDSQLEEHGVNQDTGSLSVQHSDDALDLGVQV